MNLENIDKKESASDDISLALLILNIKEWYRYLLSKWLTILIFGLLGAGLGFIVAYIKKPTYTAITTFVLEDSSAGGGLGSFGGLASIMGVDVGGGGGGIFQGDNILQLYKSRKMIQKTLLTEVENGGKKQLLIDRYIDFNNLREHWKKNSELKNIKFESLNSEPLKQFTRVQDSVLGVIVNEINRSYLTVTKIDKKLSVISAELKAGDEFFAKAFNEQIVKNVNDFYVQTKIKKSLENVAILQQKTDSVRAVMNGSIYTAAIATDATPNLNPTRQAQRIVPVQRSQFAMEANKVMLSELLKNLELSKISLRKDAPLIQVIDEPILPLYKYQLGKAKAIVLGSMIAGFLIVAFLTLKLFFKNFN